MIRLLFSDPTTFTDDHVCGPEVCLYKRNYREHLEVQIS